MNKTYLELLKNNLKYQLDIQRFAEDGSEGNEGNEEKQPNS